MRNMRSEREAATTTASKMFQTSLRYGLIGPSLLNSKPLAMILIDASIVKRQVKPISIKPTIVMRRPFGSSVGLSRTKRILLSKIRTRIIFSKT